MGNYYDDKLMEELRNKQKKLIKNFLEWSENKDAIKLCYSDEQYTNSLDADEVDKLITDYINRFKVGNND